MLHWRQHLLHRNIRKGLCNNNVTALSGKLANFADVSKRGERLLKRQQTTSNHQQNYNTPHKQ